MSTTSPNQTTEQRLMEKFLQKVEEKIDNTPSEELQPAFLEFMRKLFADNSVTMASVQRGDYGQFAKDVADEFPTFEDHEEDGSPKFVN